MIAVRYAGDIFSLKNRTKISIYITHLLKVTVYLDKPIPWIFWLITENLQEYGHVTSNRQYEAVDTNHHWYQAVSIPTILEEYLRDNNAPGGGC